jgi:hypothetical protein
MSGEFDFGFREVECPTAAALLTLQNEVGGLVLQVESGLEAHPFDQKVSAQRVASELRSVAQIAGNAVLGCINCYGNGIYAKGKTACMPNNVARLEELRAKQEVWQPQADALLRSSPEE